MKQSSRATLTRVNRDAFPSDNLFDRLGRAICDASCLPRKELFEAWEFARRVRRRFRGGRILDIAAGHGLAAYVMLLLDDSSPEAICIDRKPPPSAAKLADVLVERWPRLAGRVTYQQTKAKRVSATNESLVISVHGCGKLTDRALDMAIAARARVAVLPCCHNIKHSDTGSLTGWVDGPLAVDVTRAHRLRAANYRIYTSVIPDTITPKNRLLMGAPIVAPIEPDELRCLPPTSV